MAGVFISYRRSDGGGWAGRLNDHLTLRFGPNLIWQDVDDLKAGSDYLPQILKGIRAADAVLVVIGPNWLREGRKRLRDRKDVLRMELICALKKKMGVIPTLVGGAPMPEAKHLPPAVSGLVKRQGVTISDIDWSRGMQLLFDKLQNIVRSTSGKTEPLPQLHSTMEQMQGQYFGLMIPNPTKALNVMDRALQVLNEQMPSYPNDHYLQMFRGFFLKNRAMSLRDLGDQQGFENTLKEADNVFKTIKDEAELYLANAYTGLGGTTVLKGKLEEGLKLIDKALNLVPEHPYAQHDRAEVLQFMKSNRT